MATETAATETYEIAAARMILRGIGECSCGECARWYTEEFVRGLTHLARENCMTGAINDNLDQIGY